MRFFLSSRLLFVLIALALLFPQSIAKADPIVIDPNDSRDNSIPNKFVIDDRILQNQPPSEPGQESTQYQNNEQRRENPTGSVFRLLAIGGNIPADNPRACNDFNAPNRWKGVTWGRQYGGWGLQAENDGYIFIADNTLFADETGVCNGRCQKISGSKPYHGLLVSPLFSAPANVTVTARVGYYIRKLAGANKDDQAVSIHIKSSAPGVSQTASPRNGYATDKWVQLESTLTMGPEGGDIYVVLEATSRIKDALSTIYLDDVELEIDPNTPNSTFFKQCVAEGDQ